MEIDLGLKNAWDSLTRWGVVVLVLLTLALWFVVGLLGSVIGFEPFIPINGKLLTQRSITDLLSSKKKNATNYNESVSFNPAVDLPISSQVILDNKLRGDSLQKELSKYNTLSNAL